MSKRLKYKEGDSVGNCTFIREETSQERNGDIHRKCWFKCLCGNLFLCRPTFIYNKKRNGCGCRLTGGAKFNNHGLAKRNNRAPEYVAWYAMKERCLNHLGRAYKYYGGRGITICERWLGENGLKNFIADMGLRPSKNHSLDRYPDKNGNYGPDNCRWATKQEQANNTRRNIYLTRNGETKTITEWANILQINPVTIFGRHYNNWPADKILTRQKNIHFKNRMPNA